MKRLDSRDFVWRGGWRQRDYDMGIRTLDMGIEPFQARDFAARIIGGCQRDGHESQKTPGIKGRVQKRKLVYQCRKHRDKPNTALHADEYRQFRDQYRRHKHKYPRHMSDRR